MCSVPNADFGTPKPPPAPNLHPATPDFNLRIVHSNLSVKLQLHELARNPFPSNLLTTIFPAATLLPVSGGSGMLLLAAQPSHISKCEEFFNILSPPASDIAGRLSLFPHRIWLRCATTSIRYSYSMAVTNNDMHASVYVRPIRKPPDFDRFDATVRSAAAHNFKETFEAGQRIPARLRPLQQGASMRIRYAAFGKANFNFKANFETV